MVNITLTLHIMILQSIDCVATRPEILSFLYSLPAEEKEIKDLRKNKYYTRFKSPNAFKKKNVLGVLKEKLFHSVSRC